MGGAVRSVKKQGGEKRPEEGKKIRPSNPLSVLGFWAKSEICCRMLFQDSLRGGLLWINCWFVAYLWTKYPISRLLKCTQLIQERFLNSILLLTQFIYPYVYVYMLDTSHTWFCTTICHLSVKHTFHECVSVSVTLLEETLSWKAFSLTSEPDCLQTCSIEKSH